MWHRLAFAKGHMLVAARPYFFRQDAQWPWLFPKRFRNAQWRLDGSNPGCRIVGSSTSEELTIRADFHSSRHWEMMSITLLDECMPREGLRNGRRFRGC